MQPRKIDSARIQTEPGGSAVAEPPSVILPELEFRKRPSKPNGEADRITVSRWTIPKVEQPIELRADPKNVDDSHVVTCALIPTAADLSFYGREFYNGQVAKQILLITGPGQPIRTIQRKPFDGIRMYLPQSLFAECYEEVYKKPATSQIVVTDPVMMMDSMIETLMRMVYESDREGGPFVPTFVEGVSMAIASHMLNRDARRTSAPSVRQGEALAKWRLKRVLEYIDANLSRAIYLAELSAVAGLSRMRFAAQFRAATGHSPHAFILRKKVIRSQELLSSPEMALVDIALVLGFRSQAHFSSVFKKYVGETPARWRNSILDRIGPGFGTFGD